MRKKSNVIKKIFGILLSVFMLLGTVSTAFAADGNASITINRGNGITTSLENMTVNAYLVLDQVNDEEPEANKKQYKVTDEFKKFFNIDDTTLGIFNGTVDGKAYISYDADQNHLTYSDTSSTGAIEVSATKLDVTYPQADIVSRLGADDPTGVQAGGEASNVAIFYTWMEKYIEANSASFTATATATETSVAVNGLKEGYYALTFANVPVGISVKQGIMIATNGNGADAASINLKAEEIPLTKQVKNSQHNGEEFNNDTPVQETTADIGDTLEYQITSKIPTIADKTNLTVYKFEDTLNNQKLTGTMTLTLSKDGKEEIIYKVAVPDNAGKAYFSQDTGEQIAALTTGDYTSKSQKFTVDFLPMSQDGVIDNQITDLLTNYQGYTVTLTYQAKLTGDAVRVNGNEVKLVIHNNNNETTDTDKTKVYTYGIDVQKTFSDGRITDDKVVFQLRTDKDKEETAIQMRDVSGLGGEYRVGEENEEGKTSNLKLNPTNGKLTVSGLDVGTYWLVETATNASDGFSLAEPIQIVLVKSDADPSKLDAEASTAKYTGEGDDFLTSVNTIADDNSTTISLGQFTVLNQKGFRLPQTGGAGIWMLTLGGIALIAVAGGLFAVSRKKPVR